MKSPSILMKKCIREELYLLFDEIGLNMIKYSQISFYICKDYVYQNVRNKKLNLPNAVRLNGVAITLSANIATIIRLHLR